MHKRVDAGTDVAMIGAWDAARGALPFSADQQKRYRKSLEKEASAGHVFLIHTGADGGGPVDVYVDEDAPADVRTTVRRLDGEFLVALPSGRLVVGGAEEYRADGEAVGEVGEDRVIVVSAGDYAVYCYVAKDDEDEEGGEYASLAECEAKVLTSEEREYYHKKDYRELALILVGWLLFLAFLPLARRWGWKIALPVTLVIAVPYFHWLDRRSKRRTAANVRWREINKKLSDAWEGSRASTFVLELRRVDTRDGLKGGSVSV
jgi:hypothetical protein